MSTVRSAKKKNKADPGDGEQRKTLLYKTVQEGLSGEVAPEQSLVWGDGANHEAAGKSVPDEGGHVVRLGRVRGLEPGDVGIRVGRRRWELGQEPQRLASRATARPWILF